MENTIYCIMGKSGSGKDTIAKELSKLPNMKMEVACTTRPKRTGELEGKEYAFLDDDTFEASNPVAVSEYFTTKGLWRYGYLKHELDKNYSYIFIITPSQFIDIKATYPERNCVPIIITNDEESRICHVIKREEREGTPDYAEICRRIKTDALDFSTDESNFFSSIIRDSIEIYNTYNIPAKEIAEEAYIHLRRKAQTNAFLKS